MAGIVTQKPKKTITSKGNAADKLKAEKPGAAASSKNGSTAYDADSIQTLKDMEAVRKRPGMYIGGTGQGGLMQLLWELIDNAVDEATTGHCTKAQITFHKDGSVEVADNGRGIPVNEHPQRKKISALEVVFTELHAGGKFKAGAYGATGGLHGVGASVVNALSSKLQVEVDREGKTWGLDFKDGTAGKFSSGTAFRSGHTLKKLKTVSKTKTGTRVRFWANREIFDPEAEFDFEEVCRRVKRACCLVPGLKITVTDKRKGGKSPFEFVSKNGLIDLLKESLGDEKPINKPLTITGTQTFEEKVPVDGKPTKVLRECQVQIALMWTDRYDSEVQSFVNTVPTPDGGTHLAGFDRALQFVTNNIMLTNMKKLSKLQKEGSGGVAKKEDIYEGLLAAVKVDFPEPQFRGQTKRELGTPQIQSIVYQVAKNKLTSWTEKEAPKAHINAIRDKIANAILARTASRQALENKRRAAKVNSTGMPDKLADCRTPGPDAELIIVEGESAAGPAKAGRDAEYMAILPLRGKVVNAAKASQKQVLDNAEAQALFTAIGTGIQGDFVLENARYGRIIILCDADVDGSHIRCLLLTLIHKYMPKLLEGGQGICSSTPALHHKGRRSDSESL